MNNIDKPRCRYNHKTKEWDVLVRVTNTFTFIYPNGRSAELPMCLYDSYKDIYK